MSAETELIQLKGSLRGLADGWREAAGLREGYANARPPLDIAAARQAGYADALRNLAGDIDLLLMRYAAQADVAPAPRAPVDAKTGRTT